MIGAMLAVAAAIAVLATAARLACAAVGTAGALAILAMGRRTIGDDRGIVAAVLGRDRLPGQALDVAQLVALLGVAERDGDARGAGARRAADAVDVGSPARRAARSSRRGVTSIDVDAARGDVGRHQHADLARRERRRAPARAGAGSCCRGWRQRRMPAASRWRATRSAPRLVRVKTSARDICGRRTARPAARASCWLSTWITRWRDAARRSLPTGVTATLTGSRSSSSASLPISRGMVAEKNRFWRLCGKVRDDAADRRQEAQVEHLVGLVEHEDLACPRATMLRSRKVVEQPAGRGDQHVDAARQRLDLRPVADAAEHDGDGEAEMAAVGAEALGDLGGQLAGRGTAPARGSPCAVPGGGRRPGGAGSAARRRRSCRCRSGRCRAGRGRRARPGWPWPGSASACRIAFGLQRLQDRRGEAEVGKFRQWIGLSCGRAQRPRRHRASGASATRGRSLRHPACPGLSDGRLFGALNRRTK